MSQASIILTWKSLQSKDFDIGVVGGSLVLISENCLEYFFQVKLVVGEC